MVPHVVEARYVSGYVIWLRFDDGLEGEVDLEEELYGEVFLSLRDVDAFQRFWVHPELRTVVWENGADFAPEFLHDKVQVLSRG